MKTKIKNIGLYTSIFFLFIYLSCDMGRQISHVYKDYPMIDITESVWFKPQNTGTTSAAEYVYIEIWDWDEWYENAQTSYHTENPFIIYDIHLNDEKNFNIDTSNVPFNQKLENSHDSTSFNIYFKPTAAGDLSDDIIIKANNKTYHVKIYGRGIEG